MICCLGCASLCALQCTLCCVSASFAGEELAQNPQVQAFIQQQQVEEAERKQRAEDRIRFAWLKDEMHTEVQQGVKEQVTTHMQQALAQQLQVTEQRLNKHIQSLEAENKSLKQQVQALQGESKTIKQQAQAQQTQQTQAEQRFERLAQQLQVSERECERVRQQVVTQHTQLTQLTQSVTQRQEGLAQEVARQAGDWERRLNEEQATSQELVRSVRQELQTQLQQWQAKLTLVISTCICCIACTLCILIFYTCICIRIRCVLSCCLQYRKHWHCYGY